MIEFLGDLCFLETTITFFFCLEQALIRVERVVSGLPASPLTHGRNRLTYTVSHAAPTRHGSPGVLCSHVKG